MTQAGRPSAPTGSLALALAVLLTACTWLLIPRGADFFNYADYFELVREAGLVGAFEGRFEPVFAVATVVVSGLAASETAMFGLLMAASLTVKLRAFAALSPTSRVFVALVLVYSIRYLPLHDLTQLRVAMALALWLWSLHAARLTSALLLGALAAFTHYSAVLLLPVIPLWHFVRAGGAERWLRLEPWLLSFAALVIAASGLLLGPALETLSVVFSILALYSNEGFGDDKVNLLSTAILVDVVLVATGWLMVGRSARARFWLGLLTLSLLAFYVLREYPVLAHRIREMLALCWIPYLASTLGRGDNGGLVRMHGQLVVVLLVPGHLYLNFIGDNALFVLGSARP